MKTRQNLSKDKQELVMNLSPVYDKWREETLEQGRREMLSRFVPTLLQDGWTIAQIAARLQVSEEAVQQTQN